MYLQCSPKLLCCHLYVICIQTPFAARLMPCWKESGSQLAEHLLSFWKVSICIAHRALIRQGLLMLTCIMLAEHSVGVLPHGLAPAMLLRCCVPILQVTPLKAHIL